MPWKKKSKRAKTHSSSFLNSCQTGIIYFIFKIPLISWSRAAVCEESVESWAAKKLKTKANFKHFMKMAGNGNMFDGKLGSFSIVRPPFYGICIFFAYLQTLYLSQHCTAQKKSSWNKFPTTSNATMRYPKLHYFVPQMAFQRWHSRGLNVLFMLLFFGKKKLNWICNEAIVGWNSEGFAEARHLDCFWEGKFSFELKFFIVSLRHYAQWLILQTCELKVSKHCSLAPFFYAPASGSLDLFVWRQKSEAKNGNSTTLSREHRKKSGKELRVMLKWLH